MIRSVVVRADRPSAGQVAVRRDDDPALSPGWAPGTRAAVSGPTAVASASRHRTARTSPGPGVGRRVALRRVPGDRQGSHRAAVERSVRRDDAQLPARRIGGPAVTPCDLVRRPLAVAPSWQKKTRPGRPTRPSKAFGKRDPALVGSEVADAPERRDPIGHRRHDGRMGVPERVHGDPATRSRYSRPSASQTRQTPRTRASGGSRSCASSPRPNDGAVRRCSCVRLPVGGPWCRCPVGEHLEQQRVGIRPSMTWARSIPPLTASAQACIFGSMPVSSCSISRSSDRTTCDHFVRRGPVRVQTFDIGEDDELVGAQGHGQRRRRGIGVDVAYTWPSPPMPTLDTTGMSPSSSKVVTKSGRTAATSPTKPMSVFPRRPPPVGGRW